MLFLFTINSPRKKQFRQNTIYNAFLTKKQLVLITRKIHLMKKNIFELKTLHSNKKNQFRFKNETILKVNCIFTKKITEKKEEN